MTFKPGDMVRSIFKPENVYRAEKNNNGWLTVRCADQRNSDLVYPRMRASIFVSATAG